MFFQANKDYKTQEEFMTSVNKLNIDLNGHTGEEYVTYHITLPKENTIKGLDFMNSAIRYPIFRKEDMLKENPIVDAEFQRQESNPYYVLTDTINHLLWVTTIVVRIS